MKRQRLVGKKRGNVYVSVFLILVALALACISHGSWSWVGATAWCWKYDDGWGIAHGSVGWGGMDRGSWATLATIDNRYRNDGGAIDQVGGGGESHIGDFTTGGTSYATISGWDFGGNYHSDSNSDSM